MEDTFNISTNVFLVGPMGVGKTTIGRNVATLLNFTFIDSDREIEERTGTTIPIIFELEGELGFRRRESAVIADLTERQRIVLATGGGVILSRENRNHLKNRGFVIYLHASSKHLFERTLLSRNRPLLNTGSLRERRERLAKILKERHPLYKATADVTIETGHCTIQQVVRQVFICLQRFRQLTHN